MSERICRAIIAVVIILFVSDIAAVSVNAAVAPSITVQPVGQTVVVGQTATFSVTATGTGHLSYQWSKNGANISGGTSSSYTTPVTTTADNGAQFSVAIRNSAGSVISNSVALVVTVAPTITRQPIGQTVTAGQTAIFSVVAVGTAPLSYQWSKNGVNISGATSSSYTTPATTTADSGAQFSVVVSNSVGSVTSSSATLTVNAAAVAPTITTQPIGQTVTAGQTAIFSVVAVGTAPLSYQWSKNGVNISGATSSSYTTPATTTADSGAQFSVVVSNSVGSVTSSSATLTVNAAAVAPTITTQPIGQTVTAGQTAIFSVVAVGTAPLSYQWSKNGVNISGATSSSYTTPATTTADSGAQFSVVVSNSVGSVTSSSATLTVNAAAVAPTITTQPIGQTVTAGQTAIFSVVAVGTAPLSYQWSKNGVNISGATSSSYTTPATTTADSGAQFSVVVSNSVGSVTSSSATLTVNAAAVAPTITTQPIGQTVTAGQTAIFSVVAVGTAPLSYQWSKNGVNISGATSSSYTTPATTTGDSGAQFSVIVSNSAGSVTGSSATLTVSASSGCPCAVWTSTAVPTVTDGGPDSPVELGVTFRSDTNGYVTGIRFYKSSGNTGAHVGNLWSGTGTLLATANFTGESASGWQQVNFSSPVAIVANTAYVASYHTNAGHYSADENYFSTSGVDTPPLHAITDGSGGLNGPYAYGSGSSFPNTTYKSTNYWVDLVFNTSVTTTPVAPTITTQPASSTVVAGQTATFSVVAVGTAPLSYQWSKNGVNISGATSSSYTTPATTTADSGAQFSVVVSNPAGSATSNNATLTVNAATRLISANPTSLSFGNVNVSGSSLLTSTLTNSGNSNVTVSSVSIAGAGLNVSGLSTGQVLLPSQTATLGVTFAPAVTGSVTGSVVVKSDASNSPTTVSLSGTGVQLVTHSAALSWTASSSSVVGYNVYSSTASGGPYAKITASLATGVTYQDSSVQSGKTYYYVVTAVNASNVESVYSNQVSAVVP